MYPAEQMLNSSERKSMLIHMQRSLQVSRYLCQKGFPFLCTRKLKKKLNTYNVQHHNVAMYFKNE